MRRMLTLEVTKRSAGKPDVLRKKGLLPAVLYGRHEASTPIEVDMRAFDRLFKEAGESTVIELSGLGTPKQALIHDIDMDPVTGVVRHADFYVIEKGQKVTVSVPLEFVGTSLAVKDLGGILVKVMHELEIEVDATELPQAIEVDIASLTTLDSQIKVADLKLPKSAVIQVDAEELVAMIDTAKEEAEEVAAPIDLSAIETSVERGKKEEEGAEGAGEEA